MFTYRAVYGETTTDEVKASSVNAALNKINNRYYHTYRFKIIDLQVLKNNVWVWVV